MKSSFDLNKFDTPVRLVFFCLSALPFLWIIYAYHYEQLGLKPFETLMVVTGHSALVFLIISLAITPLRRWLIWGFRCSNKMKWGKRLSDWNILIRSRRMFGIYSFFYTSLHMVAYLDLELSWLWDELLWELQERHFISIGLASWLALLMLTLTSPKAIQRRMKKWWRRVHRLVYPLSLLVIVHFVMSTKETNLQPYYYLAIVVVLLLHRILVAYLPTLVSREDTGMEHTRK